ncbi:HNH endonuclease signature motif containing protein [Microbispora sp. H10830]|uniref:HNH endonuclease signature motif containing protein n=1 Tax=Microbispora sp. H10830 TaxID=2729109 RepID=UPI0016013606|nr:HNH endonuclease signature motif containing protein [Microbispora sp. H10830]
MLPPSRTAVPIPDGLTLIPPGAELAGLLAEVNVERVSGFDTVEVLKAAYRQVCHHRAWFLRALLEVGLRDLFSGDEVARLEVPDEFGPDEARAALVWSRRRADSTFELAWNVHRRLPILGEAMLAGTLDEPRAVAFVRWTVGLTDEQAALVCEQLVPQASSWTVGELIERIQRLALAIDPAWAERRYAEAVRRRRVVGTRNEDGTATVSGLDLPLDRAAAGCDRIDELARACKRAGDRRPIDHIRVDLFLGSLDGTFEGMSDEEIITHVLCHPFHDTPAAREGDAGNAPDGDNNAGGSGDDPDHPGRDGGVRPDIGPNRPGGYGGCGGVHPDSDPNGVRPGTAPNRPGGGGVVRPANDLDERGGGRTDSANSPNGTDGFTDADRDAAEDDRDAETCSRPGNGSGGLSPACGSHPTDPHPSGPEETAFGAPAPDDETGRGGTGPDKAGSDKAVPGKAGSDRAGPDKAGSDKAGSDRAGLRHAQAEAHAQADAGVWARAGGWPVREIRVELTTLLGLDEHPAHLPAWGVIHPCLARRIVAGMFGQWRYAICHDNGHLALTGLTRARPHPSGRNRPARDRRRGGIVELQITHSLLRVLAAQPASVFGAWAPVVADLSTQAARLLAAGEGATAPEATAPDGTTPNRTTPNRTTPGGTTPDGTRPDGTTPGGTTPDGTRPDGTRPDGTRPDGVAPDGVAPDGAASGGPIQDRDETGAPHEDGMSGGISGGRAEDLEGGAADSERRRQAGAALRRYVQIRGRVCSWPGCRTPATRTDQDHILPWAEQGPTKAENLHLACRHDHRARHHGGWRVSTASPYLVIWTSPLGHRYPSPLPKIILSACDPLPRSQPTPSPYRYLDDLPDTPTMRPAPEPPLPQEASQPDTGVATPSEPKGETGTHGSLLGSELDEPPF